MAQNGAGASGGIAVPGSVYQDLWDWDAFFTSCIVPAEGLKYATGSCCNLIEAPLREGRPSKKASVNGNYEYSLHPYPIRGQFAALMFKRGGLDTNTLALYWDKLEKSLLWYEEKSCDKEGYFLWQTYPGIDNDPSVYGRKPGAVAGTDLACLMYREYQAMSLIARGTASRVRLKYTSDSAEASVGNRRSSWSQTGQAALSNGVFRIGILGSSTVCDRNTQEIE